MIGKQQEYVALVKKLMKNGLMSNLLLEQQQYQIQHQLQQQYEHEEMDSEDQNVESSMMDTSVNHSGLIRIMKEDAASQTENDFHVIPSPLFESFVILICGLRKLVSKPL